MNENAPDSDLNEFMAELGSASEEHRKTRGANVAVERAPTESAGHKRLTDGTPVQWLSIGDEQYVQVTETIRHLPVGTYRIGQTDSGMPIFNRLRIVTDKLIRFPDSRSNAVIDGIHKFWASKKRFKALGQIHKRGVMLWGPPGSGKTATLMLLCADLMGAGGMVILCAHPALTAMALRQLRKIEPERPLICIMEDLDELVSNFGESDLLNLLDGENQVENVCFIATTNYPKRLDPRFVNRPSRFDEIVKIGMPNADSRRLYLEGILDGRLTPEQVSQWVADTEGMSLAHLKELVVSVFCLDVPYPDVIARLNIMKKCAFDERKFGIEPLVNGGLENQAKSFTFRVDSPLTPTTGR